MWELWVRIPQGAQIYYMTYLEAGEKLKELITEIRGYKLTPGSIVQVHIQGDKYLMFIDSVWSIIEKICKVKIEIIVH